MKRLRKMLHSREDAPSVSALPPGFFGEFPSVFTVSFAWRSDDNKSFIFFIKDVITEDDKNNSESARRYAFSISRRRSAHDTLTLYAGTDPDTSPPLAYAGSEKLLKSTSLITLPGRQATETNRTETLENKSSHRALTELYRFQIEVGEAGVPETFEWRGGTLDRRTDTLERRLIRLHGDGATDEAGEAGKVQEEVVGVWTDESPSPTSGNKLGTFEFLGTGATGVLGPYWTLMAVVTLLRILEVHSAGPEALAVMAGLTGGMVLTPGLI